MTLKRSLWMVAVGVFGATLANAGISYTCAANVAASTCNYLNGTIAGLYNNTFTNANANIYIQFGTTDLASSTSGFYNLVTYNTYAAALTATATKDAVDTGALAALPLDAAAYGKSDVSITSALAAALGITARANGDGLITGTTAGGAACAAPAGSNVLPAGCYDGIVTMSNAASWYYQDQVGPEGPSQFDFYGTVEHEVDEILGTASCISTTGGALTDPCDAIAAGTTPKPVNTAGTPSDVDLFRYSGKNNLVLDKSLSTTPGAYFSYNGGTSNGATGKIYNTLANGNDYADFLVSSPCQTKQAIQDATGCAGKDAGLSILNDGGAEINILDAIGYNLKSTPEPAMMGLLGVGLASLAGFKFRRRNRA
jgi:PEP-CTERM motif